MKKRVPALVLALALALTVPAWAAQDTPDIRRTTGNRVTCQKRSGVRIPIFPPEIRNLTVSDFLFFQRFSVPP